MNERGRERDGGFNELAHRIVEAGKPKIYRVKGRLETGQERVLQLKSESRLLAESPLP